MGFDFDSDRTDLRTILDMYKLVTGDEKDRKKSLRDIKLDVATLNSLNVSAFEDIDLNTIINFDVKDIITIIENTPIQMQKDPTFKKLAEELIHELSEDPRVRDKDLIKLLLEDLISKYITRIDSHSSAIGTMLMLLATEIKVSSTMLTKLQRKLEGSVLDSSEKNYEALL